MFSTVLGVTEQIPGGVVDGHAHVWIDQIDEVSGEGIFVLTDEDAIARELTDFRGAGGAAVIDCQPPQTGRNLGRLARLSRLSGVTIIASTGFHLPRYYRPGEGPWAGTESAARVLFERELTVGVANKSGEEQIRVGVIKTAHPGDLDAQFVPLLRAALEASDRTGACVLIHTEKGAGVEPLADFIEGEGGDPRRVVLCHMDKRADPGLHQELADRGFLLEYDTFYRPKYGPEENLWPLLERMLKDGYREAISCGLDLADPLMWRFSGDTGGMPGLPTQITARLEGLGASTDDLSALLRQNILGRVANAHLAGIGLGPRDRG
jgi:predicted metal-dependent phosphotriesterase family hydrolase